MVWRGEVLPAVLGFSIGVHENGTPNSAPRTRVRVPGPPGWDRIGAMELQQTPAHLGVASGYPRCRPDIKPNSILPQHTKSGVAAWQPSCGRVLKIEIIVTFHSRYRQSGRCTCTLHERSSYTLSHMAPECHLFHSCRDPS